MSWREMLMTAFVISSQDTSDSPVEARTQRQGSKMSKQTPSENETVGPTVRTPIDTMYKMLDGAWFFIHRPTSRTLHLMLPLTPIA